MAIHSLRVVAATAKVYFTITWRFSSLSGFALRFFAPIMTLGAAWVLYNQVYGGAEALSPEFVSTAGKVSYLSFITIGNAFYVFVFAAAFVVGRVMFWDRAMGTLEATFITPMSRLAYMSGVMVAAAANSMIDLAAVFIIGLLFGFQVSSFNAPLFFSALALTALALFGIGLIVNAITLSFRDRVNTANTLMILFMVFCGIVCPVELMPSWAQTVSTFLPLTYGIRLMRVSLLGIEAVDVAGNLVALLVLGAVYIGVGIVTLRLIERNLRKKALFSVF